MTWGYLNLIRFCFSVPYSLCIEKIIIKKVKKILSNYHNFLSMLPQIHIFFWSNHNKVCFMEKTWYTLDLHCKMCIKIYICYVWLYLKELITIQKKEGKVLSSTNQHNKVASVLELSKLKIYDFLYNCFLKNYKKDWKLLFLLIICSYWGLKVIYVKTLKEKQGIVWCIETQKFKVFLYK